MWLVVWAEPRTASRTFGSVPSPDCDGCSRIRDEPEYKDTYLPAGTAQSSLKNPAVTIPPGDRDDTGTFDVDDGEVGQFGHLPGVVQVVVLAESESAVEHDIPLRDSAGWDR